MPSKPAEGLATRHLEPDWGRHFWDTLAAGLPPVHLLKNPYFPESELARGGWREIIEKIFKPYREQVDGVAGRNGTWKVTPAAALNQHAIDLANLLLKEAPCHFPDPKEQTYFCFLEMAYSQFPDWALVHSAAGEVLVHEDYVLCRPNEDTTMMATVVGPVFQLHREEVRLWEAVAMKLHRAFVVVEQSEGA